MANYALQTPAQSEIENSRNDATLRSGIEHLHQGYVPTIDNNLANMFEVNRYPFAYVRLHLPKAPVWAIWVAHNHSGFQH